MKIFLKVLQTVLTIIAVLLAEKNNSNLQTLHNKVDNISFNSILNFDNTEALSDNTKALTDNY